MYLGTRVVRGPNWSPRHGETDGGQGFVGTVVDVGGKSSQVPEKHVCVQWDTGLRKNYRAGYHEAYDLRVLDSAPAGVVHPTVLCNACNNMPIRGMCWHCLDCQGTYNLCTFCYMSDAHQEDHQFERIDWPEVQGEKVSKRRGTRRIQARGIYPGAKVVRGADWVWRNQDGGVGKEGTVTEIRRWKCVPASSALILWDSEKKGKYRVGFQGKVDLKCTQPAAGCCYYNLHLPLLGKKYQEKGGMVRETHQRMKQLPDYKPSGERTRHKEREQSSLESLECRKIKEGAKREKSKSKGRENNYQKSARDKSKLSIYNDSEEKEARPEQKSLKQKESLKTRERGQDSRQNEELQKEGREHHSVETAKDNEATIKVGDNVCISLSEEIVKAINKDFGWNDQVRQHLGETGTCLGNTSSGGLRVQYSDKFEFTFHPGVVSKSDDNSKRKLEKYDYVRILDNRELVRNLQKGHGPWNETVSRVLGREGRVFDINQYNDVEVVVPGENGEETVIVFNPDALELHETRNTIEAFNPDLISMLRNMGASDQAIHEAAFDAVKQAQGQTGPDLLARQLDAAASSGNVTAVRQLLERHPDIIALNEKSVNTQALQIACHNGHSEIVSLLLAKGASTDKQDIQGYSALHHAAHSDMTGITASLLIQKGANINDNRNPNRSTPLHLAVRQFNEVTATILVEAGCNVNLQEDSGATALHIAAVNGLFDAAESILKSPDVFVDASEGNGLNPLHFMLTKRITLLVRTLLEIKPEIAAIPEKTGMMPLHFAALYDDVETAELLLETGKCDINHRNNNGLTALDLAKAAGSLSVLELLIAYSKEMNGSKVDYDYKVAMRSAAAKNCPKGCEIKKGDQVRVKTDKGLVQAYQVGHCGWNESMVVVLGKTGLVEEQIPPCNDLKVFIEDFQHSWIFNQAAVEPVTCEDKSATESDESHESDLDINQSDGEPLAATGDAVNETLNKEDLKRKVTCKICMDRNIKIVFQCGHCMCRICSEKVQTCPMCNKKIKKRLPVYI